MFKKGAYFLVVLLMICGLLSGCSKTKATQKANDNVPSLPTVTGENVDAPAWRQVEAAISDALLGTGEGKCEWDLWGWWEKERYIWAFCQGGPELTATAVSLPLVVRLASDGSIETILYPQEGTDYTVNVKRLFPPIVQEKIFANEFDLYTAVSHLETRWNYPSMPPTIFTRAGAALPATGGRATRAISAATANQIAQYARLGQGNIKQVRFLPDGRITVKGDLGIGFLDLENGQIQYQYQEMLVGRDGFLSPDGKLLAVVDDQTVSVFDTGTQSEKVSIDTYQVDGNVLKVQFLPDGMTLIVEKNVPSEGSSPSKVALYQLDDGTLIKTWQVNGANIALTPNGWVLTSLYGTSGLQLWSVVRSELLYTLPDIASAVSFSGDGQIMAAVGLGKVHLYWVWDGFEIGRLQKNIGTVSGVALSPDGKLVLTWSDGPYPARLWRVPAFEPVATFDIQGVTAAAFNQDGTSIVLAGDTAIGVYDVGTNTFTRVPSEIHNEIVDVSFAPDRTFSQGQRLAVLYRPGVIENWDIVNQRLLFQQSYYGATSLVYTPEPYGIALGTPEKLINMLDDENFSLIRYFEGSKDQVQDLVVNAMGQMAASSLNEVRIFSLLKQDVRDGSDVRIQGGWVSPIVWGCDLAAATDDGKIHVLNPSVSTIEKELNIPTWEPANSLAVLPDCSQLLAAAYKTIYRWDANTWEEMTQWEMPEEITSLAVSQDGSLVAIGLIDGRLQLLDSASGTLLQSLEIHKGRITALKFSPDGRFLASGGSDGVVILWEVE